MCIPQLKPVQFHVSLSSLLTRIYISLPRSILRLFYPLSNAIEEMPAILAGTGNCLVQSTKIEPIFKGFGIPFSAF